MLPCLRLFELCILRDRALEELEESRQRLRVADPLFDVFLGGMVSVSQDFLLNPQKFVISSILFYQSIDDIVDFVDWEENHNELDKGLN